MFHLSHIEQYLNELLDVASFEDYCVNGVQVEGRDDVGRIVTGVSSSVRLFDEAARTGAGAVIVHHGLFWRNTPHPLRLAGPLLMRLKILLANDISLLAYHLPLDAHPVLGNNAVIAEELELSHVEFVPIEGMKMPIAAVGTYENPVELEKFKTLADRKLNTDGMLLPLGRKSGRRFFVVSGGGSGYYADAAKAGADVIVTGELREDVVRAGEELGIAYYAAGHYNSEKWGIQALGTMLKNEFDLDVTFVDVPNPV